MLYSFAGIRPYSGQKPCFNSSISSFTVVIPLIRPRWPRRRKALPPIAMECLNQRLTDAVLGAARVAALNAIPTPLRRDAAFPVHPLQQRGIHRSSRKSYRTLDDTEVLLLRIQNHFLNSGEASHSSVAMNRVAICTPSAPAAVIRRMSLASKTLPAANTGISGSNAATSFTMSSSDCVS